MKQISQIKTVRKRSESDNGGKLIFWLGIVMVFSLIASLLGGMLTIHMTGRGDHYTASASSNLAESQQPAVLFYLSDNQLTSRQAGLFLESLTYAGIEGKRSFFQSKASSDPNSNLNSEQPGEDDMKKQQLRQSLDSFRQSVLEKPVWLMLLASDAYLAADLPADTFDGLIIIESPAAEGLRLSDWNRFQQNNRPVLMFGAENSLFYQSALSLFEQITGEDARLFEPAAAAGVHTAAQYRSTDGQILLQVYHTYWSFFLHLDYRLVADLAYELTAYYADTNLETLDPPAAYTAAGSQMFSFLRRLLFLAAGLLAVPVLTAFAFERMLRSDKKKASGSRTLRSCYSNAGSLRIFLYWLPAVLLLVILYIAANILIDASAAVLTGTVMAIPGSFGLMSWLAVWLPAQGHQPHVSEKYDKYKQDERMEDERMQDEQTAAVSDSDDVRELASTAAGQTQINGGIFIQPRLPVVLAGLALIFMTGLFWYFLIIQFGLPSITWPGVLLVFVFVLWQSPGVWFSPRSKISLQPKLSIKRADNTDNTTNTGSTDFNGGTDGVVPVSEQAKTGLGKLNKTGVAEPPKTSFVEAHMAGHDQPVSVGKRLVWLLARHFPWLIILIYAVLTASTLTCILIIFMLIWLAWADLSGRIAAHIFNQCWPGRLLRSVLLASVWLQPVFLYGLFR